MFRLIGAAFRQRRKTFVNAVSAELNINKQDAAEAVKAITGNENIRGEDLDIQKFSDISDLIGLLI
jgi:16S rRNA A1518/A1519 N6-dimethyltransferase RsmA/KsgA/DIM1 with predicted DNA glycosylase/AP lyase activity